MTRELYLLLLGLVALERGLELVISRRNLRWAKGRGGVEHGRGHFSAMVVLHALFLPACALEAIVFDREFRPALGWPMSALAIASMLLRYWVIVSLGRRWNTRVVVIPGKAPIRRGPFRVLRHPNYLAVVVEMVALPLIFGNWMTAILFSIANAFVLRERIRVEEAALVAASPGSSGR